MTTLVTERAALWPLRNAGVCSVWELVCTDLILNYGIVGLHRPFVYLGVERKKKNKFNLLCCAYSMSYAKSKRHARVRMLARDKILGPFVWMCFTGRHRVFLFSDTISLRHRVWGSEKRRFWYGLGPKRDLLIEELPSLIRSPHTTQIAEVMKGGNVACIELTFRHRASSILGQAFRYSPENAFYIFNQ